MDFTNLLLLGKHVFSSIKNYFKNKLKTPLGSNKQDYSPTKKDGREQYQSQSPPKQRRIPLIDNSPHSDAEEVDDFEGFDDQEDN